MSASYPNLPADDPLAQLAAVEAGEDEEGDPNEPPRPGEPPLDDPANPDPQPDEQADEGDDGEEHPAVAEQAPWEEERADLHRRLGSMANEIGHLRQMAQQVQQPAYEQPAAQADVPEDLTREQLRDWYDEDPVAVQEYLANKAAFEALQVSQEQNAPYLKMIDEVAASRAVDMLKTDVGADLVEKHKDRLAQAIQSDQSFFADPQTRHQRMRQVVFAAEFEATRPQGHAKPDRQRSGNGRYAPKDQHQKVHTEAGSTPAPQGNQAEDPNLHPIIQEMNQVQPKFDALGELPFIPQGM